MADTVQPLPLPVEERGRTTIADKVVERIASIAAGEVEAVTDTRTGWVRLVRGGLPQRHGRRRRGHLPHQGRGGRHLADAARGVAARVRDHVSERVTTLAGVTVTAVDVSIADVVHVETARRRVQ